MKGDVGGKRLLIVLVGPTASGKTGVAIELAKRINAEIVSADSRQIYRYLNIGTAKPLSRKLRAKSKGQRAISKPLVVKGIPHYLIDIIEPDEKYSAGRFRDNAQKVIEEIHRQGRIPLVVGGTGLYIRALVDGLAELPDAHNKLRTKLAKLAEKYGEKYLYRRLQKVDPESAQRIHPENLPRLIRALEVYQLTGIPLSIWHKKTKPADYQPRIFGLLPRRNNLYAQINERVDKMYAGGIVKELKRVLKMGYPKNSPGLEGVGYPQLIEYLEGRLTLQEAIASWKQKTRHYAKRQLTWFKKDKRITWIGIESRNFDPAIIAEKIEKILKKEGKI